MLQVQKGLGVPTDAQQRVVSQVIWWLREWKRAAGKTRRVTLGPDTVLVRPLLATRTGLKPRRCYFATLQHHTKDLLESVPSVTSKLGHATVPELWIYSQLFDFHLVELPAWHGWPWGREQHAMGTEQCGVSSRNPTTTEGNPGRAGWASKGLLVLASQVIEINWCDCLLLQIKQLHRLCCFENFKQLY